MDTHSRRVEYRHSETTYWHADALESNITAHQGTALQIRPKAADSSIQTTAIDEDGNVIKTSPRGFYLRSSFTTAILQKSYIC
jgi:DNA mismatch repair endonuclease MutH